MLNSGLWSIAIAVLSLVMLSNTTVAAQEIKVTLLGTGTPMLNINRFGMSTLVEAGSQKLLFDAGRGVVIRLHQKEGANPAHQLKISSASKLGP